MCEKKTSKYVENFWNNIIFARVTYAWLTAPVSHEHQSLKNSSEHKEPVLHWFVGGYYLEPETNLNQERAATNKYGK
jgi:hypothetical protein